MSKEQKKLSLSNKEWNILIKKISSIVNKAIILENTVPPQVKKKIEQIKEKGLECLTIIKYKNLKDE